MTTQAYLWGWFAYLIGSVGVLFVWWWLTRPLSRWGKVPLRTVLTALLLSVDIDHTHHPVTERLQGHFLYYPVLMVCGTMGRGMACGVVAHLCAGGQGCVYLGQQNR